MDGMSKKQAKEKKSIVDIAKERFKLAQEANDELRKQAIADTRFALGDSDNNWQWDDDVYENRATKSKKPCLTINITAQHCNQVINEIRQNRPTGKVVPNGGNAHLETADALAGLIRSIQSYSDAETAHDTGMEHAVYGGEGFWRVITKYESDDSFNQILAISQIANPQLVYIDPSSIEQDRSDAKWALLFEDIPRSQVEDEYPDLAVSDWSNSRDGWVAKDTVRRAEYFWCEDEPDELYLLSDQSFIRKSEAGEGFDVSLVVKKRPITSKKWYWCKLIGGSDEPVDKQEWPGKYLPIISVVGKEINVDGKVVRKGLVRDLKDSARMVNYSYSAAVETIALQTKTPYMASVESIAGYEEIWGSANSEARAYLPYNERDDAGNQLSRPAREQPALMPTAQVQMLQLSVEQMRAASGQQNANFGIKSEAASGVGIQRLKVQGEMATFHFPDNYARALKYEIRVLLDLIPKIYDTQRIVKILGIDGTQKTMVMHPDGEHPYQESEMEGIDGIFNPLLGMYDVAIDTGPSYQTQRQETAASMTELTRANPQLMQIAGDLVMKSYDFPLADEFAKRMAKALPPNLQDQEDGQEIPPQVQQAMQQMNQQIQQMDQQMHQASDAIEQRDEQMRVMQLQLDKEVTEKRKIELELQKERILKEIEEAQEDTNGLTGDHLKAQSTIRVAEINAQKDITLATMAQNEVKEDAESKQDAMEAVMTNFQSMAQMITANTVATQQLAEIVAQPKVSSVKVVKQADGSYVGEKIEG
jgi:hypothetical protein